MSGPILTIAIPTKDRPEWLRRALTSALDQLPCQSDLEILVSDNSETDLSRQMVEGWKCPALRYWRNSPPSGMVANWNLLLSQASGKYVLWLHDDDFLLPGSLEQICRVLRKTSHSFHAFSARVVDESERALKRGGRHQDLMLRPAESLQCLFTHSSFIRFPSAVVETSTARRLGGFLEKRGDLADLCMWSRLAASYGLECHAVETVAYTLHSQQATSRMFTEQTFADILEISRPFEALRIIDPKDMNAALGTFFWRFILGGAIRALKKGDLQDFSRILGLRNSSYLRLKPCPAKWRFFVGLLGTFARLGGTFKK